MDFGNLLTKVVPWIGAAATGNVPGLILMAAKEVSAALGYDVPANKDAINSAVASATPEQILALKDRDLAFQERMQAMGFAHVADMGRLQLAETQTFVGDTADARARFAGDEKIFTLAIVILLAFAVLVVGVLVVLYRMVAGDIKADPGTVAVVAGLIGTIVGYFAANAQQVVSYFFGSSKGSQNSGNAVREALTETMKQLSGKGTP